MCAAEREASATLSVGEGVRAGVLGGNAWRGGGEAEWRGGLTGVLLQCELLVCCFDFGGCGRFGDAEDLVGVDVVCRRGGVHVDGCGHLDD